MVNTVYGISNFQANLFASLAPFIAEINEPYPFTVFVSLIGVAFLATFMFDS